MDTPSVVQSAALLFSGLCGGGIAFNLAVALGAPWGRLTQGGFHVGRLPPRNRVAAAVSAALLALMTLAILARAGLGPSAPVWPGPSGWVVVALSGLSLAMNLATPSRAERRLWAPVAAAMLASALTVMLVPV